MPILHPTSTKWIPFRDMEAFAKRLRKTRLARDMTQENFAAQVGVTTQTAWSWEKHRSRPNPERMSKIASVLAVTEMFLRIGADAIADAPKEVAPGSLTSMIEEARQKFASLVGIPPSQVRLSVEFLSG
jgi:transcriptional regulator with XRE-family HTH domain